MVAGKTRGVMNTTGVLQDKIDDPHYQLTVREKEGLALAKEMLGRISNNTLFAGV